MKICVLTDDNSGLNIKDIKDSRIKILRMPIIIDGDCVFQNETISYEEFYQKMERGVNIVTSQPSPGEVCQTYDNLLKDFDYVLHVPMSSALSQTCATAQQLAENYNGKVLVIDNHRISVTLKQSIYDILTLIDKGYEPQKIKEIIEEEKSNNSIYIMVNNLTYLKKGGRITPAACLLGGTFHIKPVLQIFGGKLDAYKKCIGVKNAKIAIIDAIQNELNTKYKDIDIKDLKFSAAYTKDEGPVLELIEEFKTKTGLNVEFDVDQLSLSVATHIGPGAIALTVSKIVR